MKCTPYIFPNEEYLIFAVIDSKLDLVVSFKDKTGQWNTPRKLSDEINNNGQGNPFVTPDNKFLFFTTGESPEKDWSVKWVSIEFELKDKDLEN